MRKNELIKRLNNIPGNPEVVIWNGYVEDYQQLSPTIKEAELVKLSKEFLAAFLSLNHTTPHQEDIDRAFRNQQWTFPNEFTNEEERQLWYGNHKKRILVLSGKLRGMTSHDRLGKIHY